VTEVEPGSVTRSPNAASSLGAPRSENPPGPWAVFGVAAVLVCAVGVVFAGAGDLGTVEYDDPDYVTRNAYVQAGMTWEGLRWAAT